MSMGQSQESTNIDETKETIKREVLDFIAQYGCGKAPDEAFDTTLMCPKCGSRGQFRKAVNPHTHRKTSWECWWRVGCPKCGARTVNSFPTQEQAQSAFEANDLLREPEK